MELTTTDYTELAEEMRMYFAIGVLGGVPTPNKIDDLLEKHASRLEHVFGVEAATKFAAFLSVLGVQDTRKLTIGQYVGCLAAYWGKISLDTLYDRRHRHNPDTDYLIVDRVNAMDYVREHGITRSELSASDTDAVKELQARALKDGAALSDYWATAAVVELNNATQRAQEHALTRKRWRYHELRDDEATKAVRVRCSQDAMTWWERLSAAERGQLVDRLYREQVDK